MTMLDTVFALIACWAFGWPASVGKWLAELVNAYRAALEQEGDGHA